MKLIKQSIKYVPQESGLDGIYKQIELGGKVCYQSSHTITENSAKKFVEDVLIKNSHGRPLEHGTVYLNLPLYIPCENYIDNPYSKVKWHKNGHYVTTNYRVLVENNWLDDLKYLCEPTKYHAKRVTFNVVCDRQIQTEFKTHTSLSSTFESTRFCNYSKDKFGNEITFIESNDFPVEAILSPNYDNTYEVFYSALEEAEAYYLTLIENGVKPQYAAKVLPNATKSEGYITGFIEDWQHFLFMRDANNAHPDIQELAKSIKEQLINNNYLH